MAKKWNKLVARLEALEDAFAKLLSGQSLAKKTKRKKAKKTTRAAAKRPTRKIKKPSARKPARNTASRNAAPKKAAKKRKPRILAAAVAPMVPQALPDSL
jgi:hypothetical protein